MQITIGNSNPVNIPPPQQHGPPAPEVQKRAPERDEMENYDLEDDDGEQPASDATWKQRFLKLRAQMQKKERAISQYKRKIVESVMADI